MKLQIKLVLVGSTAILADACAPAAVWSGGAMLNVQPGERPRFVGAYDFDLLDQVRGKACVKRSKPTASTVTTYWVGQLPFAGTPPGDPLTLGAIAAASTDAIDMISGADTILVTRVITEGQSADQVCAYVYGRAVRLKKAARSAPDGEEHAPKAASDDSDDTTK